MMKTIRVYQCKNSDVGILSGIYEAGISGYGHEYIRIEVLGEISEFTLFSEYIPVEEDEDKAKRVLDAIRKKISYKAYMYVMRGLLSADPGRGNVIYQFITYGFTMGRSITEAMQLPCVQEMFRLDRKIANEEHRFVEIVRFQDMEEGKGVLFSLIEPDNRILSLIMPHFCDRLNGERFLIYDKTHGEVGVHQRGKDYIIYYPGDEEEEQLSKIWKKQDTISDLWKVFFEHIEVKERQNKALQRNLMPLKYREHMTEFL